MLQQKQLFLYKSCDKIKSQSRAKRRINMKKLLQEGSVWMENLLHSISPEKMSGEELKNIIDKETKARGYSAEASDIFYEGAWREFLEFLILYRQNEERLKKNM
jgi:hypothetical protein